MDIAACRFWSVQRGVWNGRRGGERRPLHDPMYLYRFNDSCETKHKTHSEIGGKPRERESERDFLGET